MSGGKVIENEEEAWASFNPFLQDSLKHTEILERLAADADAFYYATSSDEDSNDHLDSTTLTEKHNVPPIEDNIQMIKQCIVPLSLQKTQLTLHYQNEIEKEACFPNTTSSSRVPIESVASILYHVEFSENQQNTLSFSPTNHIMNFLQQISDPIYITDTNRASRYLVQAVNTHSLCSVASQISVFKIHSTISDEMSCEIVWECQLPLKHVVTHIAILNTHENNAQEKKCSSLHKTLSNESDEKKELKRLKSLPWIVIVLSTIIEDCEKCYTITTDFPSYLSIFCITTGLTYLKTIPLKYGLVFDILLSSNLRQCFQKNNTDFINKSNGNNIFGLLTYSQRLYIIENISINPKNDFKNSFEKTYLTTRFQQKCLNLHGLVSHDQITLQYVKLFQTPSKCIRVCVLFSNGIAYCYDEYNMAHRLDTLDFPPSDISCTLQHPPFTPSDISISFVKDTSIACFESVALLQEESWRYHLFHKQKETQEPFEASSMTLANILIDCLQKSSLMESLGITDSSFSLHHLPLQQLCFTNTQHSVESSVLKTFESPVLQTSKLLTCFTLDHLCHQVTASTLLVSKDEYLYWMMLLCIYCVVNEKEEILYTLFNSCLTSIYEEYQKMLSKNVLDELQHFSKFHFFPNNQHSLNSYEDSSTWSALSSCTIQECSSHTLQEHKESYEPFIFNYWMDLKILYDMNLSPTSLLFDYIIKTLLPSSAWKHFTLDDTQHVILPLYSSSDFSTLEDNITVTKTFDPFYHVVCNVLKKNDQTTIPSLISENQLQKLIHLFETMKQKINKLQIHTACSTNR